MSAPTCCGVRLTPGLSCVVCLGDPACRYVPPEEEGEKGWSLGYRKPTGREARIIEEWDAAAYERDNPIGGGR